MELEDKTRLIESMKSSKAYKLNFKAENTKSLEDPKFSTLFFEISYYIASYKILWSPFFLSALD